MDLTGLTSMIQVSVIIRYGNLEPAAADIDLLIISDDFSSMFFSKRIRLIHSILRAERPIDPICLTWREWAAYQKKQPAFCQNILQGEVLYRDHFQS